MGGARLERCKGEVGVQRDGRALGVGEASRYGSMHGVPHRIYGGEASGGAGRVSAWVASTLSPLTAGGGGRRGVAHLRKRAVETIGVIVGVVLPCTVGHRHPNQLVLALVLRLRRLLLGGTARALQLAVNVLKCAGVTLADVGGGLDLIAGRLAAPGAARRLINEAALATRRWYDPPGRFAWRFDPTRSASRPSSPPGVAFWRCEGRGRALAS